MRYNLQLVLISNLMLLNYRSCNKAPWTFQFSVITSFCSVGVLVLTPVRSFHLRTPMTACRTHEPRLPVLALDSSSTTPHKTEFTTKPLPGPSFSLLSATSLIGNDLLSLIKPGEVSRWRFLTHSHSYITRIINHHNPTSQAKSFIFIMRFRVTQLLLPTTFIIGWKLSKKIN